MLFRGYSFLIYRFGDFVRWAHGFHVVGIGDDQREFVQDNSVGDGLGPIAFAVYANLSKKRGRRALITAMLSRVF